MSSVAEIPRKEELVYPESDGQPMADNTKQLRWIFILVGNLLAMFRDVADVFVGGNQFWYPVEGHPEIVNAPDGYVVFGRPKGDRPSWKQWEEDDIPLTCVIEVLSPKNTKKEMEEKRQFYEHYGVEEYYLYDPYKNILKIWVRKRTSFLQVRSIKTYVSKRLGIRFEMTRPEMTVYRQDGRPFLTFEELEAAREQAERQLGEAEERATGAEERATSAEQRATSAEQRAEMVLRLGEVSRKARRGEASPEELQELDRLEQQFLPPS